MDGKWFQAYERQILAVILLIAAMHGLLYVNIVPPWQHPDEPTHFEYVWMIVNKGELPVAEQYDWDFRADLVRSLIEHQFYWNLPEPNPDDLSPVPAGLTYPQLDDPPVYYLFASLPLRLVSNADLADQVIVTRNASFLLFLVTIVAAWGVLREITTPESPWRFLVPLTMAMVPGYVDLMTAVNNDVGAVAVFSLFLWGSARAIQHGPTVLNLLWVVLAAAVAFFTKSTAYLAVPLAGLVLLLAFIRGTRRRLAWGLILGGMVLGTLALLYWREPANWYRTTVQRVPVRGANPDAPLGDYVLQLNTRSETTPRWLQPLTQPLPTDLAASLGGKTLTVGFWIWADPASLPPGGSNIRGPELNIDLENFTYSLPLSGRPQFHAYQVVVPEQPGRIWLSFSPLNRDREAGPIIYLDGLVLVEGSFPTNLPPDFADKSADRGTWSGIPFENLLRNGSLEETWPAFRPQVDNFLAQLIPSNIRPSMVLYSLFDSGASGGYYLFTANNLFDSFWGRFGWSHVLLPNPEFTYPLIKTLTLIGFIGAVFYPFGKSRELPVDVLLFFGVVLIAVWGSVLARGVIFIFVDHIFIPSARYGFPAIIPTLTLIVAGWFGLLGYLSRWLRIPHAIWYVLYLLILLVFDVVALVEIGNFYQSIPQ